MNLRKKSEIPVDVYIPFVETLFRDGLTLSIGILAQTFLIGLVWWKNGDPLYLLVAIAMTRPSVRPRRLPRLSNGYAPRFVDGSSTVASAFAD